jgi:hypothetical protein
LVEWAVDLDVGIGVAFGACVLAGAETLAAAGTLAAAATLAPPDFGEAGGEAGGVPAGFALTFALAAGFAAAATGLGEAVLVGEGFTAAGFVAAGAFPPAEVDFAAGFVPFGAGVALFELVAGLFAKSYASRRGSRGWHAAAREGPEGGDRRARVPDEPDCGSGACETRLPRPQKPREKDAEDSHLAGFRQKRRDATRKALADAPHGGQVGEPVGGPAGGPVGGRTTDPLTEADD